MQIVVLAGGTGGARFLRGVRAAAPEAHITAVVNTGDDVTMHGLRMDPRVVIVPVGGSVEFKNDDRVPHTLYVEKATTLMPPAPTPAG